jgi:hypothetical protein
LDFAIELRLVALTGQELNGLLDRQGEPTPGGFADKPCYGVFGVPKGSAWNGAMYNLCAVRFAKVLLIRQSIQRRRLTDNQITVGGMK